MNDPIPTEHQVPEEVIEKAVEAQEAREYNPKTYSIEHVDQPDLASMSEARLRGYLMPLMNASLGVRDGLEALLEHPHAVETLGDLAEPMKTISDKMWRLMMAAMARSS